MKRYLSLIFIIALTIIIAGCGGNGLADKYEASKKIEIAEELTAEELLALVEEAQENIENTTKVSINLVVKGEITEDGKTEKQTGEAKIVLDYSNPEDGKVQVNYEATMGKEKASIDLYALDGYTYMHSVNEEGEEKGKYPAEYGVETGYVSSLIMIVDEILSAVDDLIEEASFGKDKDGNIIIQSSEKLDDEYNNEYRLVIKDGLVQYAYIDSGEEDYCQKFIFTFNYKDVKFDFPKNFDGYIDVTEKEE